MLAQEVVREFGEKARFGVEDFGASPMADRFGIDRYPALFVDDVLVATPTDFYAWGQERKGRYVPWSELANRRKFQADLRRMIEIRLAGGELPPARLATGRTDRLVPPVHFTDLAGKQLSLRDLRGRPLLVEVWAPWCPPCLQTLSFFGKLDPAQVAIVGIAVESDRADVEKVLAKLSPPGRFAMATPELLEALGGIPAVPTLFLADAEGRIVRTFFGAPPDLHREIERELANLRHRENAPGMM